LTTEKKTRQKPSQQKTQGGPEPALAWSGDDPVAYGRAMATLDEAGIRMFEIAEHDQFLGVPQISGARYRVIVAKSESARAEKIIRETLGAGKP
jgi:hypothetical protein